jgi:hypothetical protein
MQTFIDKFMGRNYHLALLICGGGLFLCWYTRMTGGEYVTLCLGIFGGFRAGDAVVNWIHRDDTKTVVKVSETDVASTASVSRPSTKSDLPSDTTDHGKKDHE